MRISLKAGLLIVIIFLCIILLAGDILPRYTVFLHGFYYEGPGMSLVVGIVVIAAAAVALDYQKRRKPKEEAPKPVELGVIIFLCIIWLIGRLSMGSWYFLASGYLVMGVVVIAVVAVALDYQKRRKPKEEAPKPVEPRITAEPTEFRAPAKLREPRMPQKLKQLSMAFNLGAKCSDTSTLLNSFIEDPSPTNDRKAWEGFKDFVEIVEQTLSEYGLHDEYTELIKLRNALGRLRRKRSEHRIAGRDDLADKTEDRIQSNYGNSIRIIKEIQQKLTDLGG